MPDFKYVIGDGRALSAAEQQRTRVRCGEIDPERVFEYLYGYRADSEGIKAMNTALAAVLPNITRCQRDLLATEFGKNETTVAELTTPTDALFDDPVDANVRKLEVALQDIKAHIGN